MSFSLLIHPDVYNELCDAIDYYKYRQEGLEQRFSDDWNAALDVLEKHPYSFQLVHRTFRHINLQGFPYVIIYEIQDRTFYIYKLIHAKQNPSRRYKKK